MEMHPSVDEVLEGNTPDDYILMQYTGFKDKNGVEIYEGDVVRFVNATQEYDAVHVIEWKHVGFVVNGWTAHLIYEGTTAAVIGNIYSNPELVEAAK